MKLNPLIGNQPKWQWDLKTVHDGQYAVNTLDELTDAMDRRWGVGRLRHLIDPELRAKVDAQRLKTTQAIRSGSIDDVLVQCRRMCNALRAADEAATRAWATAPASRVMACVTPAGRRLVIVQGDDDIASVPLADGDSAYSLEEIARMIDGMPAIVREVKSKFSRSRVEMLKPAAAIDSDWNADEGDDIPF
jgi:hypothetical protein